jgi:hypothetical protein
MDMRYRIENQLDIFEFHDAEFSLVGYDQNELVLSAKHLNIHRDVKENPHDCDMEIDAAQIVLTKFEVISCEPMRAYQKDDDGNWYTDEPQIIYTGEEARNYFLREIKKGIAINCIDICKKGNRSQIEWSTCGPTYFFATFTFAGAVVEWDAYCKKAWYELHKQYRSNITLMTPDGETETKIRIICHEEDMYNLDGQLEEAPIVTAGIEYDGKEYWGRGKEYDWEDAFADLQKKLPEGVFLKCCTTCRHGNMCPYGNEPGELFCTKDFVIHSKEELCEWFDRSGWSEVSTHERNVTDSCGDYQPQSKEIYTYNSFLYYLEQ